ncbi:MAG: DUF362 domain-containing protein [Acidobacteria bacterium]|nr:DUF362 domain-containing protein [Acidobacteriota bacterium]
MVSRRELLGGFAASAAASFAKPAPANTVAIARCRNYQEDIYGKLAGMFDQIGGVGSIVKNKTVALKLNLTGNPRRFPLDPAMPYRTQPDTVLATVRLLAKAGAKRVRIIETFFPAKQDMALWGRYALDVNAINNAGCKVEWENCQNLGQGAKYVTVKVPGGGYIFPSYDLNHSFVDCDAYVSMSKLKNHWIAGVTMSLKNNFGITPCSLYGGDCGASGNEDPQQERGPVCHNGARTPPKGVAQEIDLSSPRDFGYRVPRIVADLARVRPIDLSIVDGVESIRGGEGVWNQGVQIIKPGVMLAGKNPVCVDAVCMAVMGYDPKATRGSKPFVRGDNTLLLAEAKGVGTTDLAKIEVAGLSIKDALHDFGPGPVGHTI